MTLNRREAEKGSGNWSPGGFGIVAMRPLCGIQHGGNRKERLRVREAGASAAGRGQRPYASFPEWQPHHNPSLQTHHPITTLSVGYCTGAGGFLRVNKMMNVMLPSLPAYISIMMTMRENVFKSRVMPVVKPTVSMAEKTSISTC